MVDRETDKTSFQVIKEFRNIFSAAFWQLTARVFGHDLLSDYNPKDGEDSVIENIINKIENEKEKINTLSFYIFEILFVYKMVQNFTTDKLVKFNLYMIFSLL